MDMRKRRWQLIVATAVTLAACSSSHARQHPSATTVAPHSDTPTTVSAHAFADALRRGDAGALSDVFAENARFFTPVLPDPIVGRTHVLRLVAVLFRTFQDAHITAELQSPSQFGLAFDAHIGAQPIHIFDLITFDTSGRIVTFVSHGRPFAGIRALALAVAPHLAAITA